MAVENASNAGSTGSPDGAELTRRAKGWLRRLVLPKGLALLLGGGGGIGGVIVTVPPRAVYYLTAAGGFTYAIRHLVHRRMKYAEASTQMQGLMRADLAIMIAFNALGIASILWKPSSWVMAAGVLVLFVAIMIVSGATIEAAKGKRKRGSEWLRKTKQMRWLERSLRPHAKVFGKPFLGLIGLATPVREVSCYIVCLLAMLVIVGTAAGRATLPAVEKALEPGGGAHTGTTTTSTTSDPATTPVTTTSTSTTPASGTTVVQAKEAPRPTYEQLCGRTMPGYPAPEPQAAGLRGLFAQTGAIVAGCAAPAAEVGAGTNVWWTLGRCQGQVRSVALAGTEGPAVLMLQQVALFAQGKAERGELIGGSARVSAAHGDYQVIATTTADYVEARQDSSLGGPTPTRLQRSCTQLTDRDAPYTLVPPALIALWLHLVEKAWVWPVAAGETETGANKFLFRSVGQAPAPVAKAECSSEFQCTMLTTAGLAETSDSDGRSAGELENYAPPPVG
jgi:hypothetical protein